MSDAIFVYDIAYHEHSNNIILTGKDEKEVTVCWRVHRIPYCTLYLEVNGDYIERNKEKLNITEKDIYQFIPGLENVEIEVTGLEYREIAPIVSFQLTNAEDDTPLAWETDSRRKIYVNATEYETSYIHKGAPVIVPVIKVQVYTPIVGRNTIPTLQMDRKRLLKLFPYREVFRYVYRESLKPIESFALSKAFRGMGWLQSSSKIAASSPFLTNYSQEWLCHCKDVQVLEKNYAPMPKLNVAFMDLSQSGQGKMELAILTKQWSETEGFSAASTDTSTCASKIVWDTDCKSDVDTPSLKEHHLIKSFANSVNSFLIEKDINVIVGYRWKTWIQRQFNSKFHLFCNRFLVTEAGSDNEKHYHQQRLGIVFLDAAKCYENHDLFPTASSYRLAHLAQIHLQMPYRARILNPNDRAEIVFKLIAKFGTLEILFNWAETCGSPWQYAFDLNMTHLSEWSYLHELYRRNFIIRQPRTVLAPQPKSVDGVEDRVQGGLILEPEIAFHNYTIQMDFESAYLRIIIAADLCLTTLTASSLQTFREDNLQLWYFQENRQEQGVLGAIFKQLLQERNFYKEELKKTPSSSLLMEAKSKAKKLAANTMYGNFNNPYWSFYCPEMAKYITGLGRMVLSKTKEWIESPRFFARTDSDKKPWTMRVIAGHTDSLFIKAGQDMIKDITTSKDVENIYNNLIDVAEFISAKINKAFPGLSLKQDAIYAMFCLIKKNCYCAIPFFLEESFDIRKCHWKGITLDEFGVAPFVRELRMQIMMDAMFLFSGRAWRTSDENTRADTRLNQRISQHLATLVERFKTDQMAFQDFILTGKFEQPLNQYSVENAPPQVQVARLLQTLADEKLPGGEYIYPGDTVEMIVAHDPTDVDKYRHFAAHLFADSLPQQSLQLHAEWYLTKHLVDKLFECLNPFQISSKEALLNDIEKFLKLKSGSNIIL